MEIEDRGRETPDAALPRFGALSKDVVISGAAGGIEIKVEIPEGLPRGLALVAHPHPLGGGANTNKVTHTLAKTFLELGYVALRPNFRGVGKSAGTHDEGRGETEDLLSALDWARAEFRDMFAGPGRACPVILAGFSFGAYCQTRVAERLTAMGTPPERMVLVGVAAGFVEGLRHYDAAPVPDDTLVIHGALDRTVPLANALAWAEPQNLSVVVVPGADHFFHKRLTLLRDIVRRAWRA